MVIHERTYSDLESQFDIQLEQDLEVRYRAERLNTLSDSYLERGNFGFLKNRIEGQNFVIGLIDGNDDEFKDIGKGLEAVVFRDAFNRPLSDVHLEYEPYDSSSTFIVAFDVSDPSQIKAAGCIRIIHGEDEQDLKSIKDFVADDPENPWQQELESMLFRGEGYDQEAAWRRVNQLAGVELKPEETHDVATLSVLQEYSSNGAINGVSIRLYHSCLRFALANKIKNLMSIQDLIPFGILQSFGEPFSTFPGIQPHPYGGPYDTVPAFCVLEDGMSNIRNNNSSIAGVFIDGEELRKDTLLLQNLDPERYSDATIRQISNQGHQALKI